MARALAVATDAARGATSSAVGAAHQLSELGLALLLLAPFALEVGREEVVPADGFGLRFGRRVSETFLHARKSWAESSHAVGEQPGSVVWTARGSATSTASDEREERSTSGRRSGSGRAGRLGRRLRFEREQVGRIGSLDRRERGRMTMPRPSVAEGRRPTVLE